MLVRPRLEQAILKKDLANLRRLRVKKSQLSDFREEKKALKSKSLSYLSLFVPVLMIVFKFSSSDSQVSEVRIATQVMKLIACYVVLWIFPVYSIFSMKRKINLMQQDCQKLEEGLRHLNN